MSSISASPLRSWSDYVSKYEEASDFLNEAQELTAQLNTDLQNLNSGSYAKIEQDADQLRALNAKLSDFPDLDQNSLNNFMTGLNGSLSQVLSNYIPMINGSKAATDMNAGSDAQAAADLADGKYTDLDASDLKHIKGLPNSDDFNKSLQTAIDDSIQVSFGVHGDPDYHLHTEKFLYNENGIEYSVTIDPTSAGPGGTHTKVTISASGTLGSFASQGLVSVQLKPGATPGAGALANFLNSF